MNAEGRRLVGGGRELGDGRDRERVVTPSYARVRRDCNWGEPVSRCGGCGGWLYRGKVCAVCVALESRT